MGISSSASSFTRNQGSEIQNFVQDHKTVITDLLALAIFQYDVSSILDGPYPLPAFPSPSQKNQTNCVLTYPFLSL